MLNQRLVGVGVNPRVDRLVADRVPSGVGRIAHRSHCATCLHAQAPADLAATNQQSRGGSEPHRGPGAASLGRRLATCVALPASWALYTPPGPRWRAISRHTTEGLHPIERAIRTWDMPASIPTIIAARSSTLSIRRQLTISPSSSTATTQIAYTL